LVFPFFTILVIVIVFEFCGAGMRISAVLERCHNQILITKTGIEEYRYAVTVYFLKQFQSRKAVEDRRRKPFLAEQVQSNDSLQRRVAVSLTEVNEADQRTFRCGVNGNPQCLRTE
jgi:hypothetical protein